MGQALLGGLSKIGQALSGSALYQGMASAMPNGLTDEPDFSPCESQTGAEARSEQAHDGTSEDVP
jgi:hypothetical protein